MRPAMAFQLKRSKASSIAAADLGPGDSTTTKWIVEGRGRGDLPIRLIYLISRHNDANVIHAMPLTKRRRHKENHEKEEA